jgi:hypothetical protein
MKAMKLLPAILLVVTCAVAQEIQQVPAEHAGKIARKVTAALGSPADAPFAVDADVEKSAGIKGGGETGLLAIPDRKFTTETVANASKTVSALGQLWMRNVVPSVNNASADPAKLRTVSVRDGDTEAKVEVYFLGITKTDAGTLELGLYAKDKEPLVKVPLVKTDALANVMPVSLDGHKDGDNTGVLVVTVFGSYKADVIVTKPRE